MDMLTHVAYHLRAFRDAYDDGLPTAKHMAY
jgi:hypothetical protein